MGFEPTQRAQEICPRVDAFMDEHVLPREHDLAISTWSRQ